MNIYTYVQSNPIVGIDPFGLQDFSPPTGKEQAKTAAKYAAKLQLCEAIKGTDKCNCIYHAELLLCGFSILNPAAWIRCILGAKKKLERCHVECGMDPDGEKPRL